MTMIFVGTAIRDTLYLPVSNHQSVTFLILRNLMTSLDPAEIERAKLNAIKCSLCKVSLMIRPSEKVCPVCGGSLSIPEKLLLTPKFCTRLISSKVN